MSEIRLVPNSLFTSPKFITVLIKSDEFRSVYAEVSKDEGEICKIYVVDGCDRKNVTTSYEEAMSAGDKNAQEITKLIQNFHKEWKKTNEVEERTHG